MTSLYLQAQGDLDEDQEESNDPVHSSLALVDSILARFFFSPPARKRGRVVTIR